MSASGNFDGLARVYRALEYLAFGRDLERARLAHLSTLQERRAILVLGEGDGRCLEQLLRFAPHASIDVVDLSAAMLARAAHRVAGTGANRVTFRQADVLNDSLPDTTYDAVVTCFFLDCFEAAQARTVIERVRRRLRPGALWLWADFAEPEAGWRRRRARIWLPILYAFFRWQTGLSNRTLPPVEAMLAAAGFAPRHQRSFQHGLVRSTVSELPTPKDAPGPSA